MARTDDHRVRVLLVEDEFLISMMMAEALTEHGELTTVSIRRIAVVLLRRRAIFRGLDASVV